MGERFKEHTASNPLAPLGLSTGAITTQLLQQQGLDVADPNKVTALQKEIDTLRDENMRLGGTMTQFLRTRDHDNQAPLMSLAARFQLMAVGKTADMEFKTHDEEMHAPVEVTLSRQG